MSSSKFGSHMQTLVQAHQLDQLKQEVHELRGEVTTLRVEIGKLTSLVSSLMATMEPPFVKQRLQPPYQPMCMQQPRQQALHQRTPPSPAPQSVTSQNQAQGVSQFNPIPIKYATLLPILLKKRLVQTRLPPRVPNPLPSWYRVDHTCIFHQGAPGHDTEQCYALRDEVQKLIKDESWSFEDPDIKVLLQPHHLAPHSIAAVRPTMDAVQNPGHQPQFQRHQQQPRQQAQKAPQYDPIPMKYAKLLPYLLERNLVRTRPLPLKPKKLPARWRPDLCCAFHQGGLGHDTEQCYPLKEEVRKLIEDDLIPFEEFELECAS
jgi:hypothetical protein